MLLDAAAYSGLFLTAFGAATILPLQSEAALVGLLLTDAYTAASLLLTATAGNVLGAIVNWWLGRGLERFRNRAWFPVSAATLDRATRQYRRFGRWSLLFSWLPIIGDPLTIVAGMLREPLASFVIIVALAKAGRYLAIWAAISGWI